jgi:outer membrane protein OmpA-like peptidoglycan-associated protein
MKKLIFSALALLLFASLNAQDGGKTKDHITAGVTGALNMSKFNVKSVASSADPGYQFNNDWAGGYWINIPLSQRLSLEPQLLYISNRMKPDNGTRTDFNGKTNYVGLPLLLKIHAGKYLAFPVGPQFDIRTSVNDYNDVYDKGNFQSFSFGLTGGVEILPKGRVTAFARYIYGLTKVNNLGNTRRPYDLSNQNIYAGLKLKLFDFKKENKVIPPPPPPPPPADTDGDGIPDNEDKCPTVKGIAKYQGCPIPDTDKDGINDEEDKCPTVPGIARYQGCPIPDTDKDGINDEEDKCPTVPGIARYQGCPIPDTDNDGVNDEEDKCVTIPGPKENFGCPIISEEVKKKVEFAAKNILFVTGSYKLQSKSFKGLNEVAQIMNDNPGMSLDIAGHTDNVGADDKNMTLSQNRANAVRDYLASKGVDASRISATGYGETVPIATNATAAGRQQNRRSELKLSYYK